MDYQIALNPELGLAPADFVQTWNTTQEARTLAEARRTSSSRTFDPFLVGAIAVLGTIGVGVATDVISDLIKQVVTKKKGHKRIRVTQINQPDGTRILVIDHEDE